jgi:hypothetical protein
MSDPLYFESHVTIEPVHGERLDRFKAIAKEHRFHVASFSKDTDGPDSLICTGRSKLLTDLDVRMIAIMKTLKDEGFWILRYKLESTIVDSRIPAT